MNAHQHDFAGSLATTMITASMALLPDEALSYLGKIASVFLLAIVAELGRRLVGKFWAKKPPEK